MPGIHVWPLDVVAGAPVFTGRQGRQVSVAPFVAGATAARPLGARSGVRPGTPSTTVSATSTTWTVNEHAGVLDVESANEAGPYTYSIDQVQTGTMTAANASYARIDLISIQVSDNAEDSLGAAAGTVVYTAGTAAAPALPTQPPRSMVLAQINVPISGGGSPSVTWVAPYLSAAGGISPNPTAAQKTALDAEATAANPVWIDDAGILKRSVGSGFVAFSAASENQPTSETTIAAPSGGETLVATTTLTGAPAGTYLALGTITAYTSTTTVAGYARFYKGATLAQERRNDLMANAGPSQEHACLITHTGGDLTVGVVVYTVGTAYSVQPKGCSIVVARVA